MKPADGGRDLCGCRPRRGAHDQFTFDASRAGLHFRSWSIACSRSVVIGRVLARDRMGVTTLPKRIGRPMTLQEASAARQLSEHYPTVGIQEHPKPLISVVHPARRQVSKSNAKLGNPICDLHLPHQNTLYRGPQSFFESTSCSIFLSRLKPGDDRHASSRRLPPGAFGTPQDPRGSGWGDAPHHHAGICSKLKKTRIHFASVSGL